ncbi:MAG: hypothetical protein ACOX27_09210 [Caldicoprobacterales bacterium]
MNHGLKIIAVVRERQKSVLHDMPGSLLLLSTRVMFLIVVLKLGDIAGTLRITTDRKTSAIPMSIAIPIVEGYGGVSLSDEDWSFS